MKHFHQLFMFTLTMMPAICLSSERESLEASTSRFLKTHGAKISSTIVFVNPEHPITDRACVLLSIAAHQDNSSQRSLLELQIPNPKDHGVSPLRTKSPQDHGIPSQTPTPPPSPEKPSK